MRNPLGRRPTGAGEDTDRAYVPDGDGTAGSGTVGSGATGFGTAGRAPGARSSGTYRTDPDPDPAPDAGEGPAARPADAHPADAHPTDGHGTQALGGAEVFGGPHPPVAMRRRRSRKRKRPLRRVAVAVLVVLLAVPAGTLAWADSKLNGRVDLSDLGEHPGPAKGTNYLIVGSDSREGLTDKEKHDLHTGSAGGRRTDSMILLHTGSSGTTMLSLPRDSWLTVPGFTSPRTGKYHRPAKNKLNASFSMGGPKMLARTIEHNTGLTIDHYVEVGFAGFVNLVDAVGGVRMCLDRNLKDKNSGADFTKGCHLLNGRAALAFVRQRHQEKRGDLGRTRNQQKFLSALAHRAAAPGTVLNPFSLYPALEAGLDTLIVDQDTGLQDLASMFRAIQGVTNGHGRQLNVPVATIGLPTPKGNAVLWDTRRAQKVFDDLRRDRPIGH